LCWHRPLTRPSTETVKTLAAGIQGKVLQRFKQVDQKFTQRANELVSSDSKKISEAVKQLQCKRYFLKSRVANVCRDKAAQELEEKLTELTKGRVKLLQSLEQAEPEFLGKYNKMLKALAGNGKQMADVKKRISKKRAAVDDEPVGNKRAKRSD